MSGNNRRERDEKGSSTSSQELEKPTAKLKTCAEVEAEARQASHYEELTEVPELSDVWTMLIKVRENNDKVLEENKEIRKLCNELTQSVKLQGDLIEALQQETKALKEEIACLKRVNTEDKEQVGFIRDDLNTAINQVDDLE